MRNILITLLFFMPALLVAQQVEQDTVSREAPQKKRIRILNSDLSKTIESDSGTVSRFRHNVKIEHEGVLMECDSAVLWPDGIFEAFGNTKVTSGATVVTGDVMIYSEITSKANVKGRIVYLTDGGSTLRTTEVDFDTGTEIGYFEHEGTIVDSFRTLESQKGYYYSKIKEFEFIGQVQSDTKDYVLQSDSMKYNTDTKIFTFYSHTHIWSGNGYLYCDRGWYDSDKDIMFFHNNSYMLSSKQEIFADSIYYESEGRKGRLYSNIQVVDTTQNTIALADLADFDMNTEDFLMRRNPSIIMYDDKDSVFIRADTIYSVTRTIKIPVSENNLSPLAPDTVFEKIIMPDTAFAASVPDSVSMNMPKIPVPKNNLSLSAPDTVFEKIAMPDTTLAAYIPDSISMNMPKTPVSNLSLSTSDTVFEKIAMPDTAFVASVPDSILQNVSQHPSADTIEYVDSTFKELFALRDAKLYRNDFQLRSDSMYFNNLDSIWRTYYNPILWNGKKMQITADSMKFYMKNGVMEHAEFNSNAMVVVPEGDPDSTIYFNQVKSKNMKAHFTNRQLTLFEAMGNAQTLAFTLSDFTMNRTEASVFKIIFESGKARRICYYDAITGDNNPLFLVREDEIKLPGYRWEIAIRPTSGAEILNRHLRPSERTRRESLSKPDFPITKRIDKIEQEKNASKEQ